MRVNETNLQALISGSKQFRVPLFQRTYTWGDAECQQLWDDVMLQYDAIRSGEASEGDGGHFIGSFVLAPAAGTASIPPFLVVDGQQRLTTLTLALAALRDAMAAGDPAAHDRITNQYLKNQYATNPSDEWKLVPTQDDRPDYFACISGPSAPRGTSQITKAYQRFAVYFAAPGDDGTPLDLQLIERVIVSRLAIVDITAQPGDNVHRIFESLNATGVGLSQADLLRNYMFMLLPNRDRTVYDEVWLPMQRSIGVENLEGLVRVNLRSAGISVRDDDVYREQQKRMRPFEDDEPRVEEEIRELARRATFYGRILFPEREERPAIRDRLEFLKRWRATTTHPLILHLYEQEADGAIDEGTFATILLNIESFLVRRLLVGVSTKNLNRIFVSVVSSVRRQDVEPLEAVRTALSSEHNFWANDDELRAAALARPLFYYGRAGQRRQILERLEESYGHKELGDLAQLNLSVEHIMPQALTAEWVAALEERGDDASEVHRALLHTLGNLTLSAYNSELSNHPFERKREIYEASHLEINKALASNDLWDSRAISARAQALAQRAIEIWPAPVDGVVPEIQGFDWGRVHAVLAGLPAGRWTSYGELAVLAGTSAQAVGNHMVGLAVPNAYRVLTADGVPSPSFRWPDSADERDVREVLISEGLVFDAAGEASRQQFVDADGLHEILEGSVASGRD